jgi:hypothetical protein
MGEVGGTEVSIGAGRFRTCGCWRLNVVLCGRLTPQFNKSRRWRPVPTSYRLD